MWCKDLLFSHVVSILFYKHHNNVNILSIDGFCSIYNRDLFPIIFPIMTCISHYDLHIFPIMTSKIFKKALKKFRLRRAFVNAAALRFFFSPRKHPPKFFPAYGPDCGAVSNHPNSIFIPIVSQLN
jgi:hypothetical protein